MKQLFVALMMVVMSFMAFADARTVVTVDTAKLNASSKHNLIR